MCETVIERWEVLVEDGGFRVGSRAAPAARGVPQPIPASAAYEVTLVGDRDLPPSERRLTSPIVTRTEIYRGRHAGVIRNLAVEPEGRLLVLHSHDTGDVYELDRTTPGAVPVRRFAAADLPDLREMTTLDVSDHLDAGRLYWMAAVDGHMVRGGTRRVVIVDRDVDGVLDEIRAEGSDERKAPPFGDASRWVLVTHVRASPDGG